MNEYVEILSSNIKIIPMKAEHAGQLEALQRIVFVTLAEEELLHAPQYLKHIEIFPEGQFVAVNDDRVVGATTSMRYDYDINHPAHHTFYETMAGGWLTTHDPKGEWLYGIDVGVHPDCRGTGIARALYRARQFTVRKFNLKGQLTVGMLSGFAKVKDKYSIDEYFEKVKNHELFDPTVSVQEKIGFEIIGLMKDYLNDPCCGNAGAVIVLAAEKKI